MTRAILNFITQRLYSNEFVFYAWESSVSEVLPSSYQSYCPDTNVYYIYVCVEVRGQLGGICSLLLPWGPSIHTQVLVLAEGTFTHWAISLALDHKLYPQWH